ncbi:hypothetical protein LTR85_011664 [Meristemomyces frigidus]|nr:hypothetical protein LTR85_011664 [Meristemomyces frigidus]
MSTQKRARACDACHSIKIKCPLGSTGEPPPCERCTRLGKECIITPPKSQKDRVAELEAKVQALTRLLEAQGLASLGSSDASDEYGTDQTRALDSGGGFIAGTKKRRLEESRSDRLMGTESGSRKEITQGITAVSYGNATSGLDQIVSVEIQARILHRYTTEVYPQFPVLALPADHTLEVLRSSQPRLLQAITYAVGWPVLSAEIQDNVAKLLMSDETAMAAGEKTLELVQAIQMACLWYWAPKHHKHLAAWQLIEISVDIALSLGLGGPTPFASASQTIVKKGESVDTLGSWRAWLMCYLLSHVASIYLRRPNANIWTPYHDECTAMLEYSSQSLPGDRLLGKYVRAEHLCEQVVSQLQLNNEDAVLDISDPAVQTTMQTLQNRIVDWQAHIPASLRLPGLLFWQHVATIHLHESVLYTANNKRSFAAPFVAERLSVTDFPAPAAVTPEHVSSLLALRTACHALLDIFDAIDSQALLALPTLLYIPRAAYAQYILNKMYIACVAAGNTFGSVLNADELRVDEYLGKAIAVATRLTAVVSHGAPASMLIGTVRTREWFQDYKATVKTSKVYDTGTAAAYVHRHEDPEQWQPPQGLLDDLAWDDFLLMSGAEPGVPADSGFNDRFANAATERFAHDAPLDGDFEL